MVFHVLNRASNRDEIFEDGNVGSGQGRKTIRRWAIGPRRIRATW